MYTHCVWREKRKNIFFPYLLQSVFCSFLWSTSSLPFSPKLNLSLLPSRALYMYIYLLIWVPIFLYSLSPTPQFYSAAEASVLYASHPATPLLFPCCSSAWKYTLPWKANLSWHTGHTNPARADPPDKKRCTPSLQAASAYAGSFQGELCCLFRPEILDV